MTFFLRKDTYKRKGRLRSPFFVLLYGQDRRTISFTNSKGEVVKTIELGAQNKGLIGFSWTDIPDSIKKLNEKLSIQAFAGNKNASDGVSTAVYNKVIAASAPKESEDVILELKDFGEVSASKAIKLKSKD